ncbi:MAG TPA: hypothetical protein VFD70_20375 [Anaerolineae bacterium]|nr:hypothetical protein [Anaerolineae bacterium]
MRLPVFGIDKISSAVAVFRLIFLMAVASLLLVGALVAAAVGFAEADVGTDVASVPELVGGTLVASAMATVAGALVGALAVG